MTSISEIENEIIKEDYNSSEEDEEEQYEETPLDEQKRTKKSMFNIEVVDELLTDTNEENKTNSKIDDLQEIYHSSDEEEEYLDYEETETENYYVSSSDEERNEMDFSESIPLNSSKESQEVDLSNDTKFDVTDEFTDNMDRLFNPSESEAKYISETAKEQVKRVVKKMEKVSVAPGELGNFKNWGTDVFLEEKCFPSLFPY